MEDVLVLRFLSWDQIYRNFDLPTSVPNFLSQIKPFFKLKISMNRAKYALQKVIMSGREQASNPKFDQKSGEAEVNYTTTLTNNNWSLTEIWNGDGKTGAGMDWEPKRKAVRHCLLCILPSRKISARSFDRKRFKSNYCHLLPTPNRAPPIPNHFQLVQKERILVITRAPPGVWLSRFTNAISINESKTLCAGLLGHS